MLTNRSTFEDELNVILDKYNSNKKVLEQIENNLIKNNNVLLSDFKNIINKLIPLETININLLYVICKEFYKITGESKINPEKYFTKIEIEEGDKWCNEIEPSHKFPLTFTNVERVAEDQFITKITAQKLAELYNNNVIKYNKETQRNVKIKKVNDSIIELPNVNINSVNEIKEEILNGTFIPNFITINILQDGSEEFIFKNNSLTINAGEINVLDGYHRSLAINSAVIENPNIEYVTGLNIVNFDKSKAIKFIIQEDKRNKISTTFIKSLNVSKFENNVVKKLNESTVSELMGKIATDKMAIKLNRAYTMYDTMADAIKLNFKLSTQKDVNDISEYLIEGFNEIIGLYPDEFINNYIRLKDKSITAHKNMFIGYVALLSKLYNTSNWKQKLADVLKKLNFDITNKEFIELGLFNDVISKTTMRNISEYFKNLV